ncbi:3-hydroxypropionyl-coenzyme A dehydratase (plasmid) [Cupriavidus necator N-1]|uniref:3-hydroxypropionyl-coenzyme A dehydratase n=1 Tax=Cupriavidus necator (strain ATCC 43291 / DSM 13513 / CCUG 52238 / LMG 8453 / N-1) TaxID=1042878 RepID=F8GXD1_CUPNN|nr:enoyl-CoA hydratase/isomerase family protein [Cupriavidus necator]AEI82001.1 3-hydroxypropionyl-coenzyme A dehydratase [Cupriavidus necator N-1]MDX6008319.1 enoyl-CoA hydratase/isomerase family protein [Cupriavidus necator]
MDSRQEHLIVERADDFLWITINRAEKANAMTVAIMEGITAAIRAGASDPTVKAVLLTAAGARVFSGGADVREQPEDGDMARQRERRSQALAALQDAVMDNPVPVVTALNGIASGGGAMLALLSDACVAADAASLSLPEIDLGIPTFSGANILEVIGGRALALDLIQTGRRMSAREALTRGLVAAVVPADELKHAATVLATTLGAKERRVFADNKHWINRQLKAALSEARAEHARHRKAIAKGEAQSLPR